MGQETIATANGPRGSPAERSGPLKRKGPGPVWDRMGLGAFTASIGDTSRGGENIGNLMGMYREI